MCNTINNKFNLIFILIFLNYKVIFLYILFFFFFIFIFIYFLKKKKKSNKNKKVNEKNKIIEEINTNNKKIYIVIIYYSLKG